MKLPSTSSLLLACLGASVTIANTPPANCAIDDSSPILPSVVFPIKYRDDVSPTPSGEALITEQNGTGWVFDLPELPAASTCVLTFTFKYCTDLLLAGYPCHEWSGLKQQKLRGSGMSIFHLMSYYIPFETLDYPVQLTPGELTWVGTFDCGGSLKMIKFGARALNEWYLKYNQMGIGQWKDSNGEGAAVYVCHK